MSLRTTGWLLRAAVTLPVVVALVALGRSQWMPVLDLAMTEFRVRDVFGRHTPLIGLPGRIGVFPDQGSHPGPLSFYLLMPVYRLFGSSSFGLLAGAAVVNVAAAWTAIWVAGRRGGVRLVWGIGALLAVLLAWLGASVLTQPWNPYLPLVSFVVVLLCTWGVLDGDHVLLVPLVLFSTLCAQTHVPYLVLCIVLCLVAFGSVTWQWWTSRHADAGTLSPLSPLSPLPMLRSPMVRSPHARSVGAAVLLGAVLWLPVFVDEVRRTPGNITMLRRHFLSPPEEPVGYVIGLKTVLAHFDVTRIVTGIADRGDEAEHLVALGGGRWWIGGAVLVMWAVAAVWSLRLADRRIARLHLVVAVSTGVALFSTGRIFGRVWYYLTLWSWSVALLAVLASVWTAVAWTERDDAARPDRPRRLPLQQMAIALVVAGSVAAVIDAARVDPPEARLSRVLDHVVEPTADALVAGIGAADGVDGVYVVYWEDAYFFGSQGFGLISELERRGFTTGAYETYRVPVTPQRILQPWEVTAEVVLTTGIYVDEWRRHPDAVEVAYFEPRSVDELAEFARLRTESIARLREVGLDDLVPLVDSNLFLARIDTRLPADVERMLNRMLYLGEETAIFVAPPGSF